MKKSLITFLSPDDERELALRLRAAVPKIQFVDDQIWRSPSPPVRDSILDCASSLSYLWSPTVAAQLPSYEQSDATFRGPASGVVIQLYRSRLAEDDFGRSVLFAGSIGTGFDPNTEQGQRMYDFTKIVWRILNAVAPHRAIHVAPHTREVLGPRAHGFRVGRGATRWCEENSSRFLRYDGRTYLYYLPDDLIDSPAA